jgi:nucleotide-binding universal stress UspA family protein
MTGIVVGVDGSAHSERALGWAVNEAAARRSPLTVIIVYPVGDRAGALSSVSTASPASCVAQAWYGRVLSSTVRAFPHGTSVTRDRGPFPALPIEAIHSEG